MALSHKLAVLADAAKYDASCASSGSKAKRGGKGVGSTEGGGICHSYTPDGRCVSLLKILLTNYCMFDCKYCINRISSNVERAAIRALEASPMRGMDALHVGAAMAAGVDLFVTADVRQFNGAQAFGLKATLLQNGKGAA